MMRVLKSTKDFERFGGLNPVTIRVSTENSKADLILGRCAVFIPATNDEARVTQSVAPLHTGRTAMPCTLTRALPDEA